MVFPLSDAKEHYAEVYNENPNSAKGLTHEILVGAVGYSASQAFRKYQPGEGIDAEELLSSLIEAEVERLSMKKHIDWLDRGRAILDAGKQARFLLRTLDSNEDDEQSKNEPSAEEGDQQDEQFSAIRGLHFDSATDSGLVGDRDSHYSTGFDPQYAWEGEEKPKSNVSGHEEQYAADRDENEYRPESASRPEAKYPPHYDQQYVV